MRNASGKKGFDNNRVTFTRSSFRRFSQSLNKRTNQSDKLQTSHNESFKMAGAASSKSVVDKEGHIPVGIMKSTQVKEQTLNPVWNESFRLNAVFAFPILAFTSASDSPHSSMMLPS
ncbi:unnamed protein product [Schistosoma curassoni]|uniref:C2 domain-containing protein n=1 Tax=Schistosoma curassoni TaxID=6186 RepID=A0A183JK55_9TREM|nr:unnamed protein product [Schistosoma curassoni]